MLPTSGDVEGAGPGYVVDYVSGQRVRAKPEELEAVQPFSRRLVEVYGYDRSLIQTRPQFQIRPSPSARPSWPVDIAVFTTEERRDEDLFMVVECKRRRREDGRHQLELYLQNSRATLGVWYNGSEHLYLQRVYRPDGSVDFREIPSIPRRGQRLEDIGSYRKRDLRVPTELRSVFRDMRNHLAGGTRRMIRDEQLAEQLINLLFCKIYDETNTNLDDDVQFRVGVNESPAAVKKRMEGLFRDVKQRYGDVFSNRDEIALDADSVVYVVGELQNYLVTDADLDVLGDAFEVFIGRALKGPQGQFFTPRNLVRMAVGILDPEPDQLVIDPACGTGGFLIVALEYVWKKLDALAGRRGWSEGRLAREKQRLAFERFRGIDKDLFLAKITKAYMALIGDGRAGVFCENSLESPDSWSPGARESVSLGGFDILLTNPPFGAKIRVRRAALEQYELGRVWRKEKATGRWTRSSRRAASRPPQVVFLERSLQLLRPGGRMAIVLPEGMLSNPRDAYILEFIRAHAKIRAIIDCPMSTFLPLVPTKTCLLVLEKAERPAPERVFMAFARTCGHDKRGRPVFKPSKDGQAIPDDDLLEIGAVYRNLESAPRSAYTRKGFFIEPDEIRADILMPKYYNPDIARSLTQMAETGRWEVVSIGQLCESGVLEIRRGHEVGSGQYGSGPIPFIRSSELGNWEILADPTHCLGEGVYQEYARKQQLRDRDILFVNDGTYLMGRTAMLSGEDTRVVIQSHIRRIRVLRPEALNPFLLLGLLGLDIVQQQVEAKTFRQATISTLGGRLAEVLLPIPTDPVLRGRVAHTVQRIVQGRARLRREAMHADIDGNAANLMGVINRGHLGNL